MTNAPTPKSPVSVRVIGKDRELLEELSREGTASGVLLEGLRTLGGIRTRPGMPLYPRSVEDPDIAAVIDEAAEAAVRVLDGLFEGKPAETMGISSNFHGGLREHIEAMLTGRPAARRTARLVLKPLLGEEGCLGRVRAATTTEGYSVMSRPARHGEPALFFHLDRRAFVPLERMSADVLFTSELAAQQEVFEWLRNTGRSPQGMNLSMCLLGWDPNTEDPLELREVAR